jgi:hypothetical protein
MALRRIGSWRRSRRLYGYTHHERQTQRHRSAGVACRRSCPHRRHADHEAGPTAPVELAANHPQSSSGVTCGPHRRLTHLPRNIEVVATVRGFRRQFTPRSPSAYSLGIESACRSVATHVLDLNCGTATVVPIEIVIKIRHPNCGVVEV